MKGIAFHDFRSLSGIKHGYDTLSFLMTLSLGM
jgi:hypothetical protein